MKEHNDSEKTGIEGKLGCIAAAVSGNSTRVQEARDKITGSVDDAATKIESSVGLLSNKLTELTASLDKHAGSNKRTAIVMVILTVVLALATAISAWGAYQQAKAAKATSVQASGNAATPATPVTTP